MKIMGEVPKINRVYNKNKGINKYEKSMGVAAGGKDQVSISNKGKDFQVVMRALRETPDVRKELVDNIESKIKEGTYSVSGRDIIDKLLKSSVSEKFDL